MICQSRLEGAAMRLCGKIVWLDRAPRVRRQFCLAARRRNSLAHCRHDDAEVRLSAAQAR